MNMTKDSQIRRAWDIANSANAGEEVKIDRFGIDGNIQLYITKDPGFRASEDENDDPEYNLVILKIFDEQDKFLGGSTDIRIDGAELEDVLEEVYRTGKIGEVYVAL